MTAVAVWSKPPTPDDLLRWRLARGWTPTATPMIDGDVVMGHAACTVRPVAEGKVTESPSG